MRILHLVIKKEGGGGHKLQFYSKITFLAIAMLKRADLFNGENGGAVVYKDIG